MTTHPQGKLNGTPSAYCVFDLMNTEFPPLRWIVDGLIPEGTILVAGKPKGGKSWLVLNIMLSVVAKLYFLNRPVSQCGALYLALEDNARRMQSRMKVLLASYQAPLECLKQFEYRCDWPKGVEGAKLLDAYLSTRPHIKVVSVDVLQNIKPMTNSNKASYDLDYEAIEPWKKVAEKYGITLIIVHHTRKAEAADVFDEISGTLGINGVVDQLIVLRRIFGQEFATLHFRGRDLPQDHELTVELVDGWWFPSSQIVSMNDARKRVMEILMETKGPLKLDEILSASGKKSKGSMLKLLVRMKEDCVIKQDVNGYSLL